MPRIDRLDKAIRRRPIQKSAHWTLAEIATLREMAGAGATVPAIAAVLGRSPDGVASVAKRRGIVTGSGRAATTADGARVTEARPSFASLIGSRRFEDDPRSTKPQPAAVVYRPATHVMQVGQLG